MQLGKAPHGFRGHGEFQVGLFPCLSLIFILDVRRTNILACFLNKHCNNLPRLYDDEPKVFEEIFKSVEKSGRFFIPVLLESRSFRRVFVSPGSMALGTVGEEHPRGGAPSSSSDAGESRPSNEHVRQQSPSRDDSVECLGSIRTELREILPHIPDLTLLRWLGGKVLDPILDRFMNTPSLGSNPTSKSCSNSSLPAELESDGTTPFLFLIFIFMCLIRVLFCSYV